jgi:tRNA A37 threonylcarbamoyltransferase TsaD
MKNQLEKLFRMLIVGSAVFGGATLLTACDNEGPFEEAGEEIDDAVDDVEDEL